MKLILHPELEHLRAEFTQIADQALGAARLRKAMRGKVFYATEDGHRSMGGRSWLYKIKGRLVWADAKVVYTAHDTWYRSYCHKRCYFSVFDLTSIQYWALTLVHEAAHVQQHTVMLEATREQQFGRGKQWYSEVEADRTALRAAIQLGWGRIQMNSGKARLRRRQPNRTMQAVV